MSALPAGAAAQGGRRALSFLDPYSKNRRISPLVLGRVVLVVLLVGLYFLGRWLWGLLCGC